MNAAIGRVRADIAGRHVAVPTTVIAGHDYSGGLRMDRRQRCDRERRDRERLEKSIHS